MARNARKPANGGSNNVNDTGSTGGDGSGNTGPDTSQPGAGSGDGSGGDGGSVITPKLGNGDGNGNGNGDGAADSGEPRRKRGRPAGSGKAKGELSVGSLSEVIAFAHMGLATILKNDAWSLDDGEAKKLADAAAKVLRHYDTPAFSALAMDWVGLLMVAGNVYAPRIAVAFAGRQQPMQAQAPASPVPTEQPAVQGDGFIDIRDPLGRGGSIRMPATN